MTERADKVEIKGTSYIASFFACFYACTQNGENHRKDKLTLSERWSDEKRFID
jgi:hypothetical protein